MKIEITEKDHYGSTVYDFKSTEPGRYLIHPGPVVKDRAVAEAWKTFYESLPLGYTVDYVRARAGAIHGESGYRLSTTDGFKSPIVPSLDTLTAQLDRAIAQAPARAEAAAKRAEQAALKAAEDALARAESHLVREPRATPAQVDYAVSLLHRRIRDGEGGGFFGTSGLIVGDRVDIIAVQKLSRSQISSLIDSLKGNY